PASVTAAKRCSKISQSLQADRLLQKTSDSILKIRRSICWVRLPKSTSQKMIRQSLKVPVKKTITMHVSDRSEHSSRKRHQVSTRKNSRNALPSFQAV